MTKRAILYARVSGDDREKEGRNLEGQLEMGREYAEKHGYTVVAELAEDDRGASGAEIDLPELNRARAMARAGEFDVLVVREIDRLSRNLAKQLVVEQDLKQARVQIEYVLGEYPDSPEGNLQKHVKAAVAEYEREKTRERIVRGRRRYVRAGNVLAHGKPKYGYRLADVEDDELVIREPGRKVRYVKREKGDGLKTGKRVLVIHESEAEVIRMMFEWYTVGDEKKGPMSARVIADRLTAMEVPTWTDIHRKGKGKKRGYGEWSYSLVTYLLGDETYAGVWYYGQRNDREGIDNPREHWISVAVPAIVSREAWETAQRRKAHNRKVAGRNAKTEYLVGRRVRCDQCQCGVSGTSRRKPNKTYAYYRCAGSKGAVVGIKCNLPTFRADEVDSKVWDWVYTLFDTPEVVIRGLQEEQATREEANEPLRRELALTEELLADHRTKLKRALDLYLEGDLVAEMLTERKARLEMEIKSLEQRRAELIARLEEQSITDERIESLIALMTKVGKGLKEAEWDFAKKRRLLDALEMQVYLFVKDGVKKLRLDCILGEDVLSLLKGTKSG